MGNSLETWERFESGNVSCSFLSSLCQAVVFCNKSRYKTGKSLHTSCHPAALFQLPILGKYYASVDQVTC